MKQIIQNSENTQSQTVYSNTSDQKLTVDFLFKTNSELATPKLEGFIPLKPNSSNYYTSPYRPNLPFLISDIRSLWRSGLSARVPECQKLKMAG